MSYQHAPRDSHANGHHSASSRPPPPPQPHPHPYSAYPGTPSVPYANPYEDSYQPGMIYQSNYAPPQHHVAQSHGYYGHQPQQLDQHYQHPPYQQYPHDPPTAGYRNATQHSPQMRRYSAAPGHFPSQAGLKASTSPIAPVTHTHSQMAQQRRGSDTSGAGVPQPLQSPQAAFNSNTEPRASSRRPSVAASETSPRFVDGAAGPDAESLSDRPASILRRQSSSTKEHVQGPYEPAKLTWNTEKTLNEQNRYCYCGQDRNLLDVDVQCHKCLNFFHGRCIRLDMGPVVPFMTNYQFFCRTCSPSHKESFSRTITSWRNVCATTLANLILMKLRITHPDWDKSHYASKNREVLRVLTGWFTRKEDLVPFLEIQRHWAAICTEKEKVETTSWASSLATALIHHPDVFRVQDETSRTANSSYTLKDLDLFSFKAGYLNNIKSSAPRKRKTEDAEHAANRPAPVPVKTEVASAAVVSETLEPTKAAKTDSKPETKVEPKAVAKADPVFIPPERTSQRERPTIKADEAPVFTAKIPTIKKDSSRPVNVAAKDLAKERKPVAKKAAVPKKGEATPAKMIRRPPPYKPQDFDAKPKPPGMSQVEGHFADGPYFSVTDIPYNKRGFKYTPCEAVPAMPAIMYRAVDVEPHNARIDWCDMSPYMYLSKDGQAATTDKGFRMGRANVGVREGEWFWEVKVIRGNGEQGGHVRLGIARREASLDGPVGFDAYSYGIRDRGGEKMHISRPRPFMESFGTGDVIGFHLSLPKATKTEIVRDRIPIRYRQQLYFEQFEYTSSKDMEDLLNPAAQSTKTIKPPILQGSFLKVYKNGKLMGTAFEDIFNFWPPQSQTQRDQPAKDDGQLGYFPAISVYSGGAARLNFGPDFECPPETGILTQGFVRCISERYDEQIAEDVVYDLVDEIDFEQDLKDLSLGQQSMEVEPIREIAEYD